MKINLELRDTRLQWHSAKESYVSGILGMRSGTPTLIQVVMRSGTVDQGHSP